MREKIQRFMWGRYGNDRFNQFLMIVAIVLWLLSLFVSGSFYTLAVAVMVYAYFRMFSRNIAKRAAENQWYLRHEMKVRNYFAKMKSKRTFANKGQSGTYTQTDQTHRIFKCPNCKQKIRVPRGRGKIAITCRKCGKEFVRRS